MIIFFLIMSSIFSYAIIGVILQGSYTVSHPQLANMHYICMFNQIINRQPDVN